MSGNAHSSDIQISKTLSWLLRHGALKEKLPIQSNGYINVNILLAHKSLNGKCNIEDIKRVVADNNKQRFTLRSDNGVLEIRANQGHSLQVVDNLHLTPILNESQVQNIIHGTFYKNWDNIKKNGLSRMNRNHIHFSIGLPTDKQVISGMRSSCEIYIYLNVKSVLSSEIKLYRSANNVILSPGNEQGYIEPKYFLKVVDSRSGNNILF